VDDSQLCNGVSNYKGEDGAEEIREDYTGACEPDGNRAA
jgi:hypothetical protein